MNDQDIRTIFEGDIEPHAADYWARIDRRLEETAAEHRLRRRGRPPGSRWLLAAAAVLIVGAGGLLAARMVGDPPDEIAAVGRDEDQQVPSAQTTSKGPTPTTIPSTTIDPAGDGSDNLLLLPIDESMLADGVLTRDGDRLLLTRTNAGLFTDEVTIDIPEGSPLRNHPDAPMVSDGDQGLLVAMNGVIHRVDRRSDTSVLPVPDGVEPTTSTRLLRVSGGDDDLIIHVGETDDDFYTLDAERFEPTPEPVGIGEALLDRTRTVGPVTVALADVDSDGNGGTDGTLLSIFDSATAEDTPRHSLLVAHGDDRARIIDFDGRLVLVAVSPVDEGADPPVNHLLIDVGCVQFSCVTEISRPTTGPATLVGIQPTDVSIASAFPGLDRVDRFNRRPPTASGTYDEWATDIIESIGAARCCETYRGDLEAGTGFVWNGAEVTVLVLPASRLLGSEHPAASVSSDTTVGAARVILAGWEGEAALILCGDQGALLSLEGEEGGSSPPPPDAIAAFVDAMTNAGCEAP